MFNKSTANVGNVAAYLKDANLTGATVDVANKKITFNLDEGEPDVSVDLTALLGEYQKASIGKGLSENDFTDALKTKLDSLVVQLQSDWDQADNTKLDFIRNKPTVYAPTTTLRTLLDKLSIIGGVLAYNGVKVDTHIQPDWNETDNTKPSYILNKPTLSDPVNKAVLAKLAENANGLTFSSKHVLTIDDIVDDLNSTDTDKVLSANQGKALKELGTHANRSVIDKWTEDGTGKPLYDGNPVGGAQAQADWNQADNTKADFIKNKPNVYNPSAALKTTLGKFESNGAQGLLWDSKEVILTNDIVDNHTSTDIDKPLSANQGKVLYDELKHTIFGAPNRAAMEGITTASQGDYCRFEETEYEYLYVYLITAWGLVEKTKKYYDFEMVVESVKAGNTINFIAKCDLFVSWNNDGNYESFLGTKNTVISGSVGASKQVKILGTDVTRFQMGDGWGSFGNNDFVRRVHLIRNDKQTNATSMFGECINMIEFKADPGTYSKVTDMYGTWGHCTSLTSFPVIDTSSATSMYGTWWHCESLTSFPAIDTSKVTDMFSTWWHCKSLTSFPAIDTRKATNMQGTWGHCTSLTSFPVIDTSKVTSMRYTWSTCTSLLCIPKIDTSSATDKTEMFSGCDSLAHPTAAEQADLTDADGALYSYSCQGD